MVLLAANRSVQLSLEIRSCSLLITSWAKRRYKSSGPVRYIPGDYTQLKKTQNSSPSDISMKKEADLLENRVLKGRKVTRPVPSFDDTSRNRSSNAENMESSNMPKHVEEFLEIKDATDSVLELIDADSMEESELLDEAKDSYENMKTGEYIVCSNKTRQDAENMAIELLVTRAFTAADLRKKLCGKKYPIDLVESVITDLKCRGFLNDGLYAESFCWSRWQSLSWGPRRIKHALLQKGVSQAEADKATQLVFEEDGTNDGSQNMQLGMSKLSIDRLFLQASKQWLRGQDTPLENRKSRIVRWLQYRGFSWGVTNFILKKLETQHPP